MKTNNPPTQKGTPRHAARAAKSAPVPPTEPITEPITPAATLDGERVPEVFIQRRTRRRRAVCSLCHEHGHHHRICPQRRRRGVCSLCHEDTHTRPTCPGKAAKAPTPAGRLRLIVRRVLPELAARGWSVVAHLSRGRVVIERALTDPLHFGLCILDELSYPRSDTP